MKRLFDGLAAGAIGVKICGITNPEDLAICLEAGADALGFNFYPGSKRYIELENAREWLQSVPASVLRVAVVVNPSQVEALRLADEPFIDALQLHGDESGEFAEMIQRETGKLVIKALQVRDASSLERVADFAGFPVLLDAYSAQDRGGTGHTFDWSWLEGLTHPDIFLSGGLNPENVAAALRLTKVRFVDVASGVEDFPRRKCAEKVGKFIAQVRNFRI